MKVKVQDQSEAFIGIWMFAANRKGFIDGEYVSVDRKSFIVDWNNL